MQWTLVCAHRDVETNYWSHHKQEWITTNEYSITCNTQWKALVGFQLKILSHNAAYTSLCLPVLLLELIMSNFLELKRYTPLIRYQQQSSLHKQPTGTATDGALWVGYNYSISMTACASPICTIFIHICVYCTIQHTIDSLCTKRYNIFTQKLFCGKYVCISGSHNFLRENGLIGTRFIHISVYCTTQHPNDSISEKI